MASDWSMKNSSHEIKDFFLLLAVILLLLSVLLLFCHLCLAIFLPLKMNWTWWSTQDQLSVSFIKKLPQKTCSATTATQTIMCSSSVKHGLDTSGHNTCWWVSLSLIHLFKTNVFTTKWCVVEISHMILLKVGSLMPLVLCPAAVGDPSWSVLSTCHLLSTVAFKALLKGVDECLFQGGFIWAFNSCAAVQQRKQTASESSGEWGVGRSKSNHPSPLKSTLSGVLLCKFDLIYRKLGFTISLFSFQPVTVSEIGGRRTHS